VIDPVMVDIPASVVIPKEKRVADISSPFPSLRLLDVIKIKGLLVASSRICIDETSV